MKTLLMIAALAITLPAAAQVHMWIDEDGRKHFGSVPPAGQGQQIHIGETNSADAPEARQRQPTRPEPQRRVEESGSDWACDWAKRRLQRLEERWEDVKRQGYTVADQESYKRQKADVMREIRDDCR